MGNKAVDEISGVGGEGAREERLQVIKAPSEKKLSPLHRTPQYLILTE